MSFQSKPTVAALFLQFDRAGEAGQGKRNVVEQP